MSDREIMPSPALSAKAVKKVKRLSRAGLLYTTQSLFESKPLSAAGIVHSASKYTQSLFSFGTVKKNGNDALSTAAVNRFFQITLAILVITDVSYKGFFAAVASRS